MIQLWLTPLGETKFSQAAVGSIPPIVFTQGQYGSGGLGGVPLPYANLSNPEGMSPVTSVLVNGNQIEIGFHVGHAIGDFTLDEVGLFDSEGDILAVGLVPPLAKYATGDAIQDVYIQLVLQHSNAAAVVVQTNPSANFVTYGDMEVLFSKLFKGAKQYKGIIPIAGNQVDVTITEVDPTKAFVVHNGTIGNNDSNVPVTTTIEILNSTTVRCTRFDVPGDTQFAWTVAFTVVEFGNPLEVV